MGVNIDMEMPTSCDDCRLNNGISCYAVPEYTEDGVVGRTDDRPDWCPLVHVQPHGRLIDADALKVSLAFAEKTAEWAVPALRAVLMVIDEMPTIIPADSSKEAKDA